MHSRRPTDHVTRLERANLALGGVHVGDCFGERFFGPAEAACARIRARTLAAPPWRYTDDTEMSVAIVDVLTTHGYIDRDLLATRFAHRWADDPGRGYGGGAHSLLHALCLGKPWRAEASALFQGGSFGNGGAMRAAPVGAYFAHDPDATIVAEAHASAEVTHAHPEGRAGAIAIALAAAHVCRERDTVAAARTVMDFVLAHTPHGETRDAIAVARDTPHARPVTEVADLLGTGSRVSAMDTVPFTLWCATRHLSSFEEAMWTTVEGLGDRDTTCAIVGGIVALAAPGTIPRAWQEACEPMRFHPRTPQQG